MALELLQVETADFTYAALYRDRILIDLAVDLAGEPPLYHSIWKAKIDRYLPDVGSFLALGQNHTGLLRETVAKSGDEVIVQIKSRRSEGKADIISEDIALTGRTFIYLPRANKIALSRRLDAGEGRKIEAALKAAGICGGIVRSAAPGTAIEAVLEEAHSLQSKWQAITATAGSAGMIAAGPSATDRLKTDYRDAGEVRQGTFEDYDLGSAIAALNRPDVILSRGSNIMIEPTAALTAIDVNAGSRAPDTVNAEAVEVIATQLRLRNLSGLILIDFAGGHGKSCLKLLEKALADDPAGCRVGGLTPAGLVEIIRSRRDLPLAQKLNGHT
jgi:ribonuclease E/ribonuclease G